MNDQTQQPEQKSERTEKSPRRSQQPKALVVFLTCMAVMLAVGIVLAQSVPPPVLTITPSGSNQLTITITNAPSSNAYDIYTTPVLANSAYPWKAAIIGTNGQTNFTVTMLYPDSFYEAIWDTNTVPIWEAADPNNPSAGILAVFIDSPTNGAVLQ
jgi:hypothetical protein